MTMKLIAGSILAISLFHFSYANSRNGDLAGNTGNSRCLGELANVKELELGFDRPLKYGFIDRSGHIVVKPQFEAAGDFHEGLAWAVMNGKMGFINTRGHWVVKPKFKETSDFSEGLAAVVIIATNLAAIDETGKLGYLNTRGKWAIEPRFDYGWTEHSEEWRVGLFRHHIAWVGSKEGYGLINSRGYWLAKPHLRSTFLGNLGSGYPGGWLGCFSDGLAWAILGDKYGYIDERGEWAIRPKFDYFSQYDLPDFSEGLARTGTVGMDSSPRRWGFINLRGDWVVKPQFEAAGNFSDGMAPVVYDGKVGFVNARGEWKIRSKIKAVDVGNFSSGLVAAHLGETRYMEPPGQGYKQGYKPGEWAFLNRNGEVICRVDADTVGNFSNGLTYAGLTTDQLGRDPIHAPLRYGFIDEQGKWVVKAKFEDVKRDDEDRAFSDGVAWVELDGKWGLLDTQGKWVVKPRLDNVSDFSGGLAYASLHAKYGFLNVLGKWIIKPQFADARSFSGGLAAVGVKSKSNSTRH